MTERTTYIKTTALKLVKAAQMWEPRQASVVLQHCLVVFLICIETVSNFSSAEVKLRILVSQQNCCGSFPAVGWSHQRLTGMALKHHSQGHVWETGEHHPSRPDEDVHRKHVVNLHFSLSAVICSHNMHWPPSIHSLWQCLKCGDEAAFLFPQRGGQRSGSATHRGGSHLVSWPLEQGS